MPDLVTAALEPILGHLGASGDLDSALVALQEPLRTLRHQYRVGQPDFSNDPARMAYCVAYHPYHAHLALTVLDAFADTLMFDDPVLRVVIFGAGPAPELLALVCMLSNHPQVERLEVDLVDREPGWIESRSLTVDAAIPGLWKGKCEVRHHVLDLTSSTDVVDAARLTRGCDVIFAQAVFTELRMRDKADSFFDALMEYFAPQGVLVASDMAGTKGFSDRLAEVQDRPDLRTLRSMSLQCPMPHAPVELATLYTGADGLIERRRAEVESRLYVRPGWTPSQKRDESRDVPDQDAALTKLTAFVQRGRPGVFVLTGHAGTGKTHLIGRAARHAEAEGRFVELVAPTGQAARRLAQRTGRSARTIHSALYGFNERVDREEKAPQSRFELKTDRVPGQVMFVDESSLVGNMTSSDPSDEDVVFGSGRLLDDLLTTVTSLHGQVVFVGDTYQLPPYGEDRSLALDPAYFASVGIDCESAQLSTVNRQAQESGILELAEQCRLSIDEQTALPPFEPTSGADVQRLGRHDVPGWLLGEVLAGNAAVVTFRHADARFWNRRSRSEAERPSDSPVSGDRLVTVEAAYDVGLLNGEELEVVEVGNQRRVTIRQNSIDLQHLTLVHLGETGTQTEFKSWVVKDLLESAPAEELKRVRTVLWQDFVRRAEQHEVKRGTEQFFDLLDNDPIVNALRCSYSYARTCQRAQGGEWAHALCDLAGTESIPRKRGRFAYTALTRARTTAWLHRWPQPRRLPADNFEDFVAFSVDHIERLTGHPVQRVDHTQGGSNYVSLRRQPDDRGLVVNLYRTLSAAVQKAPDGVDTTELHTVLQWWADDRLRADAEPPDPCLDEVVFELVNLVQHRGMDLHVSRPGSYQVELSLVVENRKARLRLHHNARGELGKEIDSRTDGDVELLRILREVVAKVKGE